jgi:hypothetical protein
LGRSVLLIKLQTVRLFQLNECDIVAARTIKEAVRHLQAVTGLSLEEAFDKDVACALTDEQLDKLYFCDEDDPDTPIKKFRDELLEKIASGSPFPYHFASLET